MVECEGFGYQNVLIFGLVEDLDIIYHPIFFFLFFYNKSMELKFSGNVSNRQKLEVAKIWLIQTNI